MKKWLLSSAFLLASHGAWACVPSQATAGMIGCWTVAPSMSPTTDYIDIWKPGSFPNAAQLITPQAMLATPPPIGGVLYATAYGVVADGVTSNDQSLGLALAACTQVGGKLVLPPGSISLTGASLSGGATRLVQNCSVEGAGPPQSVVGVLGGTTFLITGTSLSPFILGSSFALQGFGLYWPNQTGTVVYPPWATDNSAGASHGYLNNITIMNAYDGVAQTNGASWGDIKFNNMTVFAANDNFRFKNTGDGMTFSNVRIEPGPVLTYCNFSSPCKAAVGASSNAAVGMHILGGGTVNINANSNILFFALRYGFLLDSGALLAESQISATFDKVGTIIDASASGAVWSSGNQITGIAGCATPATIFGNPDVGNAPCFNMGANSELDLSDFLSGQSAGDFVDTAGSSVFMVGVYSNSIGQANDGGDYYQLWASAGTPQIRVIGSRFTGAPSSSKVHGITTNPSGSVTPSSFMVQNNEFLFFNEDINALLPGTTDVSGNVSGGTNGSVSFIQRGTNLISYYGNNWDKQPQPTISNCGTSPSVDGNAGPNSGLVVAGSGTVTACQVQMPLSLLGRCMFFPGLPISLGGGPVGLPPNWELNFAQGATPISEPGLIFFYSCAGQK